MRIAELKASLSETLARVKAGEEIVVTENGQPIARIVPHSPAASHASTEELIRAGILRAPKKGSGIGKDFWSLPWPEDPEGLVLKGFLQDRQDDR